MRGIAYGEMVNGARGHPAAAGMSGQHNPAAAVPVGGEMAPGYAFDTGTDDDYNVENLDYLYFPNSKCTGSLLLLCYLCLWSVECGVWTCFWYFCCCSRI